MKTGDPTLEDDSKRPVFCVFIPGGIATNEVRELRDIETSKQFGGIITLAAGTSYLTPQDYLHELKIINQHDDEEDQQVSNIAVNQDQNEEQTGLL